MAFFLRDCERSPFGLGWEKHRRNKTIDSNPFAIGTRQWVYFRDGWNGYVPSKTAEYRNEEITGPLPRDKAMRRRAG